MGRPRNTLADFWAKVDKTSSPDGCWLWTGYTAHNGYGRIRIANVQHATHRLAYELVAGPISEGLQLDHLCRIRHCCNPDHLDAVTLKENVLRGLGHSAENARKTHCDSGHEFTPKNTAYTKTQRLCIACRRQANRELRERRRILIVADPSLAPHGVLTTYSAWACRCDECKTAWSAYMAEYHRRRNANRGRRPEKRAA